MAKMIRNQLICIYKYYTNREIISNKVHIKFKSIFVQLRTIAGNASKHSVCFRPAQSDSQPNSTEPTSPPMPISAPIHDSCSSLSAPPASGVSCSDFSTRKADDGQPAVVPYEIDIRFTQTVARNWCVALLWNIFICGFWCVREETCERVPFCGTV